MIDSRALTQEEREQLAKDMSDWITSSYPGSDIAAQAAQSVMNAAVERKTEGGPGINFPTIRQKANVETVQADALRMVDKMLRDGLNEEEINARLNGDGETNLGVIGGLQVYIDEGVLFHKHDDVIQMAIEAKIAGALEKREQSATARRQRRTDRESQLERTRQMTGGRGRGRGLPHPTPETDVDVEPGARDLELFRVGPLTPSR